MKIPNRQTVRTLAAAAAAILVAAPRAATPGTDAETKEKKKPKISLRASPATGFSPLRIVVTAELKGGDSDHPDFYCPTIEWLWGDDTRAESTGDCDPYEPGKSEIQRRYVVSRVFNTAGEFKVEFRVKQRDKVMSVGSTTVRVQPGLRDGGIGAELPTPNSQIPTPNPQFRTPRFSLGSW